MPSWGSLMGRASAGSALEPCFSLPVSPVQGVYSPCAYVLLRSPSPHACRPASSLMGRQQVQSQALCALCHLATQTPFPSHFTEGKLRLESSRPIAIWW